VGASGFLPDGMGGPQAPGAGRAGAEPKIDFRGGLLLKVEIQLFYTIIA